MKRVLAIVFIIFLVVYVKYQNDIQREEIELLRDEVTNLENENQQLHNELTGIRTSLESNSSNIVELHKTNDQFSSEIDYLDMRNTEIQELRNFAYRLNKYISKMPSYKELTGFIKEYDKENNILLIDEVEWVHMDDTKRCKELNLSEHDFPNGYYIYNDETKVESYSLLEDVDYYILNVTDTIRLDYVSKDMFLESINRGYSDLYKVVLIDNTVIEVSEIYVP